MTLPHRHAPDHQGSSQPLASWQRDGHRALPGANLRGDACLTRGRLTLGSSTGHMLTENLLCITHRSWPRGAYGERNMTFPAPANVHSDEHRPGIAAPVRSAPSRSCRRSLSCVRSSLNSRPVASASASFGWRIFVLAVHRAWAGEGTAKCCLPFISIMIMLSMARGFIPKGSDLRVFSFTASGFVPYQGEPPHPNSA